MNIGCETSYKKIRSKSEEIRLEVKREWISLWKHKYEDVYTAEGVSQKHYSKLFVNEGQVIYAPRHCEPLEYEKILEKNLGSNFYQKINPPNDIGGWKKFSKDNLPIKKRREKPEIKADLSQQQRKHGKGWLNQIRINKKRNESS